MDIYPIKRTPEEGHTKACLAKAMITVIENMRDEDISDYEFRLMVQEYGMDAGVLATADRYLAEGMTICLCDPISKTDLFGPNGQLSHFGSEEA